jgi:hypothetical protein
MHNAAPMRRYRGAMLRLLVTGLLFAYACVQAANVRELDGAGLFIDVTPANRPALVGKLDFDLIPAGSGKACVDRYGTKQYWVGMDSVAKLSPDEFTRQAIAAAMQDAVSRLDDVDSILLTRVVTESKGPDRMCATITGRGVRFTKATTSATPSVPRDGSDAERRE